jgi:nucleotide-binding universal stress UspA family protein
VKLGDALDKRVEAIAVWHPAVSMYDVYSPEPGWSPEGEAREMLEGATAEAFGDMVPERLSASLRMGRTAHTLIEVSAGSELLILGSRGHGGFAGLMLGSVSAACAAHARCPVLIVRHGQSDSKSQSS